MVVVVVVCGGGGGAVGRGGSGGRGRGGGGGGGGHCRLVLPHEGGQVPLLLLAQLLDLLDPLVVCLHLLLEQGVLQPGRLLIELEDTHPVKALQVQVAPPPHADAVQDQMGMDVDLEREWRKK